MNPLSEELGAIERENFRASEERNEKEWDEDDIRDWKIENGMAEPDEQLNIYRITYGEFKDHTLAVDKEEAAMEFKRRINAKSDESSGEITVGDIIDFIQQL